MIDYPILDKEERIKHYKIVKARLNNVRESSLGYSPFWGLCGQLEHTMMMYLGKEGYGLTVRDVYPELNMVKPGTAEQDSFWWSFRPFDYDSRINALERMIELAGEAKE